MRADQLAHARIAAAGAAAAEDRGHEIAISPVQRGDEVEAGGIDVAGLDAVHAFDASKQAIVVADRVAAEGERAGREIGIIAREAFLDGAPEGRLIARGGDLVVVGQAGGVLVDGAAHAERLRLARHQPRELLLVSGDVLRQHDGGVVGRAGDDAFDRVLDLDGLPVPQAELGRTLRGRVRGHVERAVELELAGLQALEQQVERHDLGQRGRMAQRIRIGRVQDGAAIGVDHDVRIAR